MLLKRKLFMLCYHCPFFFPSATRTFLPADKHDPYAAVDVHGIRIKVFGKVLGWSLYTPIKE